MLIGVISRPTAGAMPKKEPEDTMPKIDVGKNIHAFVEDWGAGKQIVFVHGWPFNHRMFEYQMTALALRDFRVIGIDLPGFGASDKPWAGNDYDTWANDVGKIMNGLALRDVTLAGFSIGGAIVAHRLARFRDTRVSKLSLLSAPLPTAWLGQEDKNIVDGYIEGLISDRYKFIHEFIQKMPNKTASREFIESLLSMGRQASLRACLRGLEEMRDRNLQAEMGNIRIPTRIFHGVKDSIVPFGLAEQQKRLIREATLVPFENSGHALFWDEKDKLVNEIAKFADEKQARVAA